NNVLDYYKLTNNLLSLDNLLFDSYKTIKDLYSIFSKEATDKGLSLSFEFSKNLPKLLVGDEARLKQILSNLLENAIKFTDNGTIRLWADLDSEDGNSKTIRFTISDSGKGINISEIANLWQAFSVGSKSYSRNYQGIGMGLVLSKELCQLMGGDIFIKETSSLGTTFELTVVLEGNKERKRESKSKKVRKVLLVEDNLINQKLTKNLLQKIGFDVDVAENGAVAVNKFQKNVYDIILMDIQMPVMDGITACRKIRTLETERVSKTRVKIIALTANSQKQDKNDCLAAGMDDYLSKPLNPREISLIFENL
ncbi:MAG: response regulator, partial [Bacteroidales bacterium]|nr:response regulator [Bacteroidales bacterium]